MTSLKKMCSLHVLRSGRKHEPSSWLHKKSVLITRSWPQSLLLLEAPQTFSQKCRNPRATALTCQSTANNTPTVPWLTSFWWKSIMKIHTAEADLFMHSANRETRRRTVFHGNKSNFCCHFAERIAMLFPLKCQRANCKVKSFNNERNMHTKTHTFHFLHPCPASDYSRDIYQCAKSEINIGW